jgi:hypothetical protein
VKPLAFALALAPCLAAAQSQPEPPPEYGLSEMVHARAYGMGGAFHALGVDADVIDGNPASMMLFPHYVIELSGAWDVQTKYAFGSASVLDTTNPVGGGVSYHLVTIGRGDDRTIAHLTSAAAGYGLSSNIFIGATLKSAIMTGALNGNAVTMDAGLTARLFDSFTASFSGHNLIGIPNPYLPRYFVLGLGYFFSSAFTLAADFRGDFGVGGTTPFAFRAGGEYIAGDTFPLRAGYGYDTVTHSHFLSGGLGFVVDGGGFDVAYRHELGGDEGRMLAVTFKLKLG